MNDKTYKPMSILEYPSLYNSVVLYIFSILFMLLLICFYTL